MSSEKNNSLLKFANFVNVIGLRKRKPSTYKAKVVGSPVPNTNIHTQTS